MPAVADCHGIQYPVSMTQTFRFSPRPNDAHLIAWHAWGPAAFRAAESTSRLIFLNLTAAWSESCHEMDEGTLSDDEIRALLNDAFIPVRVDADHYPHIQDRYIAGDWPTNAFLTATGEVLWSGTLIGAGELLEVANGVLAAWTDRRDALLLEIERRHRALEAARGRHSEVGLVRREASADVITGMLDSFDSANAGFGQAPKFPPGDAIELLYQMGARGDVQAASMADRTLDAMLLGELMDHAEGGFFRCTTMPDWSVPRCEKLLDINAAQLEAYATGAAIRNRQDWADAARRTVDWVDRTLGLASGLWDGSQSGDRAYFQLDASRRSDVATPAVDDTVYTCWNAQWIAALASAGGRLGRNDWIVRAEAAFADLRAMMQAPNGLFYHFRTAGGERGVDFLLLDVLEAARAAVILFQATGNASHLAEARRLAQQIERRFWAADGGFWDRAETEDIAALRYRDRPFDMNARAARLLLDLAFATGERGYRALGERTLALLSPQAARYGVAGATFALAVEEFFTAPTCVVIVGDATAAHSLRAAALALPHAGRRVWSLPQGGKLGTQSVPASPAPAAYAFARHGCSPAVLDENVLAAALTPLV